MQQASLSEAQQQRLAKNRESARNSRKRKKIYYDLLEKKISEMSDECENLRELVKAQAMELQRQANEKQMVP